jgi:GNAT superfamily N-acetyltransferase
VNASLRSDYGDFYRTIDPDGPDPSSVIGVSCFIIAPPFREHGVASALLDHVIGDAASRGASSIEAYPHTERKELGAAHFFRGARSMFDARGFQLIETLDHNAVVRRPVS